jgi:hypothetical protein
MGTIKSAIYSLLSNDGTVAALTGGRISAGGDPQKGATSVVYHEISGVRGHTMDGPDTFVTPTMRVESYATSDLNATTLADAVRAVLNGYNGTADGVAISYMALDDQGDIDDFIAENRELSRHGVRQDYLVSYTES